jgi:hypothetical protein
MRTNHLLALALLLAASCAGPAPRDDRSFIVIGGREFK